MTMNIRSKKATIITSGGMTLEDVKVAITASATIPSAKKGELFSAVNSLALWFTGRPPRCPPTMGTSTGHSSG
jgi:hypothetical protein